MTKRPGSLRALDFQEFSFLIVGHGQKVWDGEGRRDEGNYLQDPDLSRPGQ